MKKLDSEETVKTLVAFLKEIFYKSGFSKAVIALSGGVDSSTSCVLTVKALGEKNVFPVILPYGQLNSQEVIDAVELISFLQIPKENIIQIDIKPLVDSIIALEETMDNIRKGNIMARTRMIILFNQAKKGNALVLGTENKSEYLLGYFTRFGDEASDVEPLRNLYKTQVYQIARYLKIPDKIVNKTPSAGLWGGQTDENELGFTYKEADRILSLLYDEKKSVAEIIKMGFPSAVVNKVSDWVYKNKFKHVLPYLPED